jgi:internalin A
MHPTEFELGKPRRRRFALSLRALMALVLLIGGGLGWTIHRAKIQREAVEAIRRTGGDVDFDWEVVVNGARSNKRKPDVPSWCLTVVGPDFFQTVVEATLYENEKVTDEVMIQVGRLDHLVNLHVLGPRLTNAGFVPLRNLKRMRSLFLNQSSANGDALANLSGMSELAELSIALELKDADLAHLSCLKSLETLEIWCEGLGDPGMVHLGQLPGLKRLDFIKGGQVSEAGLKELAKLERLEQLEIGNNPITDAGLVHLSRLSKLEFLDVRGSVITTLEPIRNLTRLRRLFVSKTGISDEGLEAVEGFVDLLYLDLGGLKVTDAGMKHLKPLVNLQYLMLNHTKIDDDGLANLTGMKKLERLSLNRTAITDEGLEHLKACSKLGQIDLANTMVTPEGIAALKEALPGCLILAR